MKTIRIPNATLTFAESKAFCPHCKTHLTADEIEKRYARQGKPHIRMRCKCGKYIGVTTNYMCDFIAYSLK